MPVPGPAVRVEAMTDAHAAAVLAIYQAGIDEGNATFETSAPRWEVRRSRPGAARDARRGG
jgi:L-amino acid N-acyltransferase YncA